MESDQSSRAALILAGGEGTRLSEYIRKIAGTAVPKQFCALTGELTLLEQTRRRAELSVKPASIFLALNRDHQRFFAPLCADAPCDRLVIQPSNRGTAPAILYSLLTVAKAMPQASLVLMPSDHHVADETALMNRIDEAFAIVENRPELTVLLGAHADRAETSYGWIEPGTALSGVSAGAFHVRRFWEKPSHQLAVRLLTERSFWNSFILVGRVSTLVGLFAVARPELWVAFSKISPSLGTVFEADVIDELYRHLQASDFSRDVLQTASINLCVLPIGDVGWSDLGEEHRVLEALSRPRKHSETRDSPTFSGPEQTQGVHAVGQTGRGATVPRWALPHEVGPTYAQLCARTHHFREESVRGRLVDLELAERIIGFPER